MMRRFLSDTNHIYLACGATDFRKQIAGLVAMVQMQFKLD
ncbi:MAG: IS66 family insertion sequence element accessory protein TnpB, partial [Alphaproteobacteria bacterium]|nr:IS66 family insertion sequence element accessory protein TnpB [Alphaproteobacteria bacterium]